MKHNITVYENGQPRQWKPHGPTRKATPRARRERQIVELILDGQTADFAKAIELMRKGCDYDKLSELGRTYRKSGRVLNTIIEADKIISDDIPAEEAPAHIRRMAILAGNPG